MDYREYFPEFTFLEKLGEGASGTVYKVMDTDDNVMAMKVPFKFFESSSSFTNNISDTTAEMYMLRHFPDIPSFPKFIDAFERDLPVGSSINKKTVTIILMEYIPGTVVANIKSFSITQARNLILRLINLVMELQRKGILHMDLHQGNIMLSDDGNLRIIDLGSLCLLYGDIHTCEDFGDPRNSRLINKYSDTHQVITTIIEILRRVKPKSLNVKKLRKYLFSELDVLSDSTAKAQDEAFDRYLTKRPDVASDYSSEQEKDITIDALPTTESILKDVRSMVGKLLVR